jgi:hypothetical protein
MNLGFSGPIFDRDVVVVKVRIDAGHNCGVLHRARELNELREIDGGILKCLILWATHVRLVLS